MWPFDQFNYGPWTVSSRSFCSSLSNTQQGLTKEGTFGRQDNSPHPKDVRVLLLRTCEYFADSADGIKLKILRWGEILAYSHGPNVITRILIRGRQESQKEKNDMKRKAREKALCCGAMTQRIQAPLEAWKGKDMYCLSPGASRKITDLWKPWFLAQWNWLPTSDLQNCKRINLVSFKPVNLG